MYYMVMGLALMKKSSSSTHANADSGSTPLHATPPGATHVAAAVPETTSVGSSAQPNGGASPLLGDGARGTLPTPAPTPDAA